MTPTASLDGISGRTAAEIADRVRDLIERDELRPGDPLPPVRALAEALGVHRNTATAAYRLLAGAGLVVASGRAGTRVASVPSTAMEGDPPRSALRSVAAGNPDAALLPDLAEALARLSRRPVLYGEAVVDPELEAWARAWTAPDLAPHELRISLTNGAFDAIERLLSQALTRSDAVALEDPCYLASIRAVRLAGYRTVPVPVDEAGMTVEGLRAALDAGVRAVVVTPRAQNPTGASLTEERAAALREVLADHPYVLVIEDDYYSMLSQRPYHSIIGAEHRRWALVRSVSKFLGPDLCLAVLATDPETSERLGLRLSSGTVWVSHLLQRIAHSLLTDDGALETIRRAGLHYAERNAAFVARLAARGIAASAGDGLSLWVPLHADARAVSVELMRRGWLTRSGEEFALDPAGGSQHLRLSVHHLSDEDADALARDLAEACAAAG